MSLGRFKTAKYCSGINNQHCKVLSSPLNLKLYVLQSFYFYELLESQGESVLAICLSVCLPVILSTEAATVTEVSLCSTAVRPGNVVVTLNDYST